METSPKHTRVFRVGNSDFLGRVDGGSKSPFYGDRKDEVARAILGNAALDLNVVAPENYSLEPKANGEVSFEEMRYTTLVQQEVLDERVQRENLSHGAEAPKTNGLAPCQIVNQEMK